jgi:phosphate:Na+ symporter
MNLSLIFGIIGGLGLFLFGMKQLSEGLQKIAGNKIHQVLEALSKNPIKGILSGTAITTILQSSSATTVITIGFVNAGLLSLKQAISIIFGANIGTTITAQIISFNLNEYVLPMIGFGFAINMMAKRKSYQYIGSIMIGFGLLFLGLSTMSDALYPLRNDPIFLNLLVNVAEKPLLGILLAALITAIIQSSSATTAIILSLSIQGLIGLAAAIPFILGTNIGTCITALLASIGSSITGKRVALGHFLFNISGVIIFYLFLNQFTFLSSLTDSSIPRQIANAHSLFNIINTLILLPFIPYILKILTRILPGKEKIIKKGTLYLDKSLINTPSIALGQVTKELIRMANISMDMLENILTALLNNNERLIQDIYLKEDIINTIHREITRYLFLVSQKALSSKQSQSLTNLMNMSGHIERIADHIENIADLAETKVNEKLSFSQKAEKDLKHIFAKVETSLKQAIKSLKEHNMEIAKIVTKREDEIDRIEEKLRNEHIDRLKKQICNPESGIIYIDILSNLERIGDHAYNISMMVLDELNNSKE